MPAHFWNYFRSKQQEDFQQKEVYVSQRTKLEPNPPPTAMPPTSKNQMHFNGIAAFAGPQGIC